MVLVWPARPRRIKAVSQMSTITLTPNTHSTRAIQANVTPPHCWCGQDLEYACRDHCPRCGRARADVLPPVARAS